MPLPSLSQATQSPIHFGVTSHDSTQHSGGMPRSNIAISPYVLTITASDQVEHEDIFQHTPQFMEQSAPGKPVNLHVAEGANGLPAIALTQQDNRKILSPGQFFDLSLALINRLNKTPSPENQNIMKALASRAMQLMHNAMAEPNYVEGDNWRKFENPWTQPLQKVLQIQGTAYQQYFAGPQAFAIDA